MSKQSCPICDAMGIEINDQGEILDVGTSAGCGAIGPPEGLTPVGYENGMVLMSDGSAFHTMDGFLAYADAERERRAARYR